jgi:hypothetical protein
VTLDEAHELGAGDALTDEWRESTLLVLEPPKADFASMYPRSQWRLRVLNLESGKLESWPNGRWDELFVLSRAA